jgi:RNA polymerase sigma factor (sigma-70 family)
LTAGSAALRPLAAEAHENDGPGEIADAFRAWRSGDPAGLERLVRLVTPTLWQLVRSYGLNRAAAEDAVQTTWLNLVRKGDTVREPRAVWGWLTITARREAWRLARADGRAAAMAPATITSLGDGSGSAGLMASPETVAMASETARRLWRYVAMLSERCRRLLRVIAFDERPDYGRLALELNMPVGSIGPTRGRCLKKLRDLMDEGKR